MSENNMSSAQLTTYMACVSTDVGLEETAVVTTGCRCLTVLLTVIAESQLRCATLHHYLAESQLSAGCKW